MELYTIDLPQGLVPYSLEIAPSAFSTMENLPEPLCDNLQRRVIPLALQPPDVKPDDGFPGKVASLSLTDKSGKEVLYVIYLVDSSTRTVTILFIEPFEKRTKRRLEFAGLLPKHK